MTTPPLFSIDFFLTYNKIINMYPGFYGESMCISDCAYTPLPLLKKKEKKCTIREKRKRVEIPKDAINNIGQRRSP